MIVFFVFLFANVETVILPGGVIKPAILLLVGFCAIIPGSPVAMSRWCRPQKPAKKRRNQGVSNRRLLKTRQGPERSWGAGATMGRTPTLPEASGL
jgi:hypothetical protein